MSNDKYCNLFSLVQSGNRPEFDTFVDKNFNSEESWRQLRHPRSGDTVATIAAQFGHVSMLSICDVIDLEISNNDGKRPLHMAAQYGQVDCVRYLLDRKVAIDCLKRADW